jgi:acetyltransferase EpsM
MSYGKIIVGAGRHAVETYYLLKDAGSDIDAFAVDKPEPGQQLHGKKIEAIGELIRAYAGMVNKPAVLVAIGSVDVNKRLSSLFKEAWFPFFNAVYPGINTERQQHIGTGVTIAAGCILTCNISVGNHVIINIGCTISHDCIIGDYVNISPGCHLAGNVHIEDEVFIGTGATFIPKVRVGKGSIIAAGACVTRDIPPYCMAAGVPAAIKKRFHE